MQQMIKGCLICLIYKRATLPCKSYLLCMHVYIDVVWMYVCMYVYGELQLIKSQHIAVRSPVNNTMGTV